MFQDRRTLTIFFVAVCLVYVAARLWRLDDSCLWFDEVFSVHAAEHDWPALFRFVAQDLIHPPLFYICLKLWTGVGGESVFWLRLLPVVFSVLAIFPFVRLCRELKFATPVVLLSLFLIAVNGALIKYTQTLRMYSMLVFFALMSMWLFARFFNRGKSFVPLLITNVLLVYTHYFGWLVIGTEIAVLLFFQRIKWRRAVVMLAVVATTFAPWLVAVWQALRNGSDLAQNIAWQARPSIRELITFATDLVEPFYFQASSAEPASVYLISLPLLLIMVASMVVYLAEWQRDENKQAIKLLASFAALPFAITFLASWLLPESVWGTRHLIIVFPPLMVLISHAMLKFPSAAIRMVLVSAVLLISCIAFYVDARREMTRHVWCAWNEVAGDIRSRQPASTTIYAFENLVAYHLWFALRDSERHHVGVVKGLDVLTADETYFLPRGFDAVSREAIDEIGTDRIWIAFRISRPGEEVAILENFTRRGYSVCSSHQNKFGPTTVLWMELSKRPCLFEGRAD